MRALVVTLALLGACDVAPTGLDAPEADASLVQRSVVDRLADLEAETSALNKQLQVAQSTITKLQTELAGVAKRQADADFQIGRIAHQVQDSFSASHTLRASVDALDAAVFDTDPVTGGRVSKIDAFTIKQGAHLVVLEDYLLAMSGQSIAGGTSDDTLRAALFEIDPSTGSEIPRVDGAGVALANRLRKRPELLYQAWEDTINDYISEMANNPIYNPDGESGTNPLSPLFQRLASTEGQLASEIGDRIASEGKIATDVKHTNVRIDATVHLIDDWQGEVAYLKIEDKLIWTESHDQRARLDGLTKGLDQTNGTVTEVKELADILKSDMVKQVGGVQADVDTLWADMLAADADLWKQLDALSGETCHIGDLAEAIAVSDWVVVDEELQRSKDSLICGTTDHL